MARGEWLDRSEADRNTLHDVLTRYLSEITPHKKGAKQERNRILALQRHEIARRGIGTIRSTDIAAFRDERKKSGLSAATINNELILLSHVFTIARREFGMESLRNPVSDVRRPKADKGRERRLMDGEESRLMDAASKVHPVLPHAIRVALETAVRRGELLAMKRKHISGAELEIPETKNGTLRRIPLTQAALNAVASIPARVDGYIWPWHRSQDTLTHAFTSACKLAGIAGLRFHDLRHEATSRLFEKGLNPMEVAAITGHKTLQMLKRYTHLKPHELLKKIERGA